ncbi:hypothetical protein BpHYR1_040412 [Brachionus plicatilis]|uniref:Transposase Tc1-like domain-containing protein n=1 Tax=Brachionus plicatilis TaxID=10195 RepID=A0A3M7R6K0_BRAPC|nr:hypothetical protein BpHYR1_040412 [Brachionus plicatilis]
MDQKSQRPSKIANFRLVRKNPTTSNRQIAADFNSKFGEHKISKETVRRVLAKKVIEAYSSVKKPLLTVSDRTKRGYVTKPDVINLRLYLIENSHHYLIGFGNLKNNPCDLKTVFNLCVSYVPSADNPADAPSRRKAPSTLLTHRNVADRV